MRQQQNKGINWKDTHWMIALRLFFMQLTEVHGTPSLTFCCQSSQKYFSVTIDFPPVFFHNQHEYAKISRSLLSNPFALILLFLDNKKFPHHRCVCTRKNVWTSQSASKLSGTYMEALSRFQWSQRNPRERILRFSLKERLCITAFTLDVCHSTRYMILHTTARYVTIHLGSQDPIANNKRDI